MLIDEADTFLRSSDEIRGILNSGHTRTSAFVIRTVGDDNEPRTFSTWAPKVIALIGDLPDTIADRSIRIPMRRKRSDETVNRLRINGKNPFEDTVRRCTRWATDSIRRLAETDAEAPHGLNDRAADNWQPLLAIAKVAGGDWLDQAYKAAGTLSGETLDEESAGAMLLADIKSIFGDKDRISSEHLVGELVKMEERPWPEWRRGKSITARQVARLLKAFDIRPKVVRMGPEVGRGYEVADFADAFSRYLPPLTPDRSVTALQPSNHGGSSDNRSVTAENRVTDRISRKAAPGLGCNGVTDQIGGKPRVVEI